MSHWNDHEARAGIVVALYDHFGRQPMPSTIADVVSDTMRWSLDYLRRAAVEVRRNTVTLRDQSLSALLSIEAKKLMAHDAALASGSSRALPPGATPATPEQRRQFIDAFRSRVRSLSEKMTP